MELGSGHGSHNQKDTIFMRASGHFWSCVNPPSIVFSLLEDPLYVGDDCGVKLLPANDGAARL